MEKTYDAINVHSLRIGFSVAEAKVVAERLSSFANEYKNLQRANEVFALSYPKHVSRVFLESQLNKFIQVVKKASFLPEDFELEEELGWSPDDCNIMYREGLASKEEVAEYLREKSEYIESTRPSRELTVLRLLEEGDFYHILAKKVYREIVRIENPNPGPRGLIYIPFGGMPGYRRKMRRR